MGVIEPMLEKAALEIDTRVSRLSVVQTWKSHPECAIEDRLSLKVPHGGKEFLCTFIFDEDDVSFLDVIIPEFSPLGFRSHPKTLEPWKIDDLNSMKLILLNIKDSLTSFCAKKYLPKTGYSRLLTRFLQDENLIYDFEIISHKNGCRILINLEFGEDCSANQKNIYQGIIVLDYQEPYQEISVICFWLNPELITISKKIPNQSNIRDCQDVRDLQECLQVFVMTVQSLHSTNVAIEEVKDEPSDDLPLEARKAFLSALKNKFNDACKFIDDKDFFTAHVMIEVQKVKISFKIQVDPDYPKSRPIFLASGLDFSSGTTHTLNPFKVEQVAEPIELANHIFDRVVPDLVKELLLKHDYVVE